MAETYNSAYENYKRRQRKREEAGRVENPTHYKRPGLDDVEAHNRRLDRIESQGDPYFRWADSDPGPTPPPPTGPRPALPGHEPRTLPSYYSEPPPPPSSPPMQWGGDATGEHEWGYPEEELREPEGLRPSPETRIGGGYADPTYDPYAQSSPVPPIQEPPYGDWSEYGRQEDHPEWGVPDWDRVIQDDPGTKNLLPSSEPQLPQDIVKQYDDYIEREGEIKSKLVEAFKAMRRKKKKIPKDWQTNPLHWIDFDDISGLASAFGRMPAGFMEMVEAFTTSATSMAKKQIAGEQVPAWYEAAMLDLYGKDWAQKVLSKKPKGKIHHTAAESAALKLLYMTGEGIEFMAEGIPKIYHTVARGGFGGKGFKNMAEYNDWVANAMLLGLGQRIPRAMKNQMKNVLNKMKTKPKPQPKPQPQEPVAAAPKTEAPASKGPLTPEEGLLGVDFEGFPPAQQSLQKVIGEAGQGAAKQKTGDLAKALGIRDLSWDPKVINSLSKKHNLSKKKVLNILRNREELLRELGGPSKTRKDLSQKGGWTSLGDLLDQMGLEGIAPKEILKVLREAGPIKRPKGAKVHRADQKKKIPVIDDWADALPGESVSEAYKGAAMRTGGPPPAKRAKVPDADAPRPQTIEDVKKGKVSTPRKDKAQKAKAEADKVKGKKILENIESNIRVEDARKAIAALKKARPEGKKRQTIAERLLEGPRQALKNRRIKDIDAKINELKKQIKRDYPKQSSVAQPAGPSAPLLGPELPKLKKRLKKLEQKREKILGEKPAGHAEDLKVQEIMKGLSPEEKQRVWGGPQKTSAKRAGAPKTVVTRHGLVEPAVEAAAAKPIKVTVKARTPGTSKLPEGRIGDAIKRGVVVKKKGSPNIVITPEMLKVPEVKELVIKIRDRATQGDFDALQALREKLAARDPSLTTTTRLTPELTTDNIKNTLRYPENAEARLPALKKMSKAKAKKSIEKHRKIIAKLRGMTDKELSNLGTTRTKVDQASIALEQNAQKLGVAKKKVAGGSSVQDVTRRQRAAGPSRDPVTGFPTRGPTIRLGDSSSPTRPQRRAGGQGKKPDEFKDPIKPEEGIGLHRSVEEVTEKVKANKRSYRSLLRMAESEKKMGKERGSAYHRRGSIMATATRGGEGGSPKTIQAAKDKVQSYQTRLDELKQLSDESLKEMFQATRTDLKETQVGINELKAHMVKNKWGRGVGTFTGGSAKKPKLTNRRSVEEIKKEVEAKLRKQGGQSTGDPTKRGLYGKTSKFPKKKTRLFTLGEGPAAPKQRRYADKDIQALERKQAEHYTPETGIKIARIKMRGRVPSLLNKAGSHKEWGVQTPGSRGPDPTALEYGYLDYYGHRVSQAGDPVRIRPGGALGDRTRFDNPPSAVWGDTSPEWGLPGATNFQGPYHRGLSLHARAKEWGPTPNISRQGPENISSGPSRLSPKEFIDYVIDTAKTYDMPANGIIELPRNSPLGTNRFWKDPRHSRGPSGELTPTPGTPQRTFLIQVSTKRPRSNSSSRLNRAYDLLQEHLHWPRRDPPRGLTHFPIVEMLNHGKKGSNYFIVRVRGTEIKVSDVKLGRTRIGPLKITDVKKKGKK